jgi:hypothetical protein
LQKFIAITELSRGNQQGREQDEVSAKIAGSLLISNDRFSWKPEIYIIHSRVAKKAIMKLKQGGSFFFKLVQLSLAYLK